jgi:CheY-like chemotaxis protein
MVAKHGRGKTKVEWQGARPARNMVQDLLLLKLIMAGTDPDEHRQPVDDPAVDPQSTSATDRPLVYVVDDEPMVGEVVQTVLESGGFRTRLFQDPVLALQSLTQTTAQPRLLLTDYRMRSMNGMELIQGCKMLRPGLKTILFSSTLEAEDLQPYAVQPDEVVSKPFQPQRLAELVRNLLVRNG